MKNKSQTTTTKTSLDKEWECRKVKLSTIIPNARNPRTITKEKFERLKKKIEEVGFHSPIKVDNEGVILGGNQRYSALVDMGLGEIEVPVMFPLFELTERDRQEIIITDNVSDGDWDTDILANEYDEDDLADWGLDLNWKDQKITDEDGQEKEIDIHKAKCKIVFSYTDSKEIIDAFLKEMHEKYPELLYEVEIDD